VFPNRPAARPLSISVTYNRGVVPFHQ
jgi:hypothetical protein